MNMKAVIIGATGATGKELTQQLLSDPQYTEVHILVRRTISLEHPKLKVHQINFDDFNSWKNVVDGDVAFSCLGTTLKDAGSKEQQKKVDFEYQLNFAKAAKENHVEHFVLVSAHMANPKSKLFYSRIKGELEESIKNLNFNTLSIFRPGLLDRQENSRPSEVSAVRAMKFFNKIGLFKNQKPLPTPVLAKALIQSAQRSEPGIKVYRLSEIFDLADQK